MNLKTSCDKCIFEQPTEGCYLKKPLFLKQKTQFTLGLCSHKRTEKWRAARAVQDIETLKMTAHDERKSLAVIIVAEGNDLNKISQSLNRIHDKEFVKQAICVVRNADTETYRQIAEKMVESGIPLWSIDNMLIEEPLDDLSCVNYSSRLVKTMWFTALHAGEYIKRHHVESIKSELNKPEANPVCFYYDKDDYFRVVTNNWAFDVMDTHLEIPWFQKVQEFNNWEKECKQLI